MAGSETIGRYDVSLESGALTLRVRAAYVRPLFELSLLLLVAGSPVPMYLGYEPSGPVLVQVLLGTLLLAMAVFRASMSAGVGIITPVHRKLIVRDRQVTVDGRTIPKVVEVMLGKQLIHRRHDTVTYYRVYLDAGEWVDAGGFRQLPDAVRLADMIRRELGIEGRVDRPFAMPAPPVTMVFSGVLILLVVIGVVMAAPLGALMSERHPPPRLFVGTAVVMMLACAVGAVLIAAAWRGSIRKWLFGLRHAARVMGTHDLKS